MRWYFLVCALCSLSCQQTETKVGDVRLAEALVVVDADKKAPLIKVPGDESVAAKKGAVRIAIDYQTEFRAVRKRVAKIKDAGGRPIYLVARRLRIKALPPFEAPQKKAIQVYAMAGGKTCVSFAEVDGYACTKGQHLNHISGTHVRELVREAHEQWGSSHAHVQIGDGVQWGDAVRVIDGSRDCCFKDKVTVSVENL